MHSSEKAYGVGMLLVCCWYVVVMLPYCRARKGNTT